MSFQLPIFHISKYVGFLCLCQFYPSLFYNLKAAPCLVLKFYIFFPVSLCFLENCFTFTLHFLEDLVIAFNARMMKLPSDIGISLPTFIIAECVLIYLDPDSTRAIVGWASKTFSTAIFFLYEQVYIIPSIFNLYLHVGCSLSFLLQLIVHAPFVVVLLYIKIMTTVYVSRCLSTDSSR